MTRRPGLHRAMTALALAAASVFSLGGCTAASPSSSDATSPGTSAAEIVRVEKRSLTSVVVVDGSVVASPTFVVPAPVAGKVGYRHGITRGAAVRRGEEVARIGAKKVMAPASGEIAAVLRANGATVAAQIPLASVRYAGFGVHARIPVTDQYRLYDGAISAKVNVESGPSGLDCRIVRRTAATSGGDGVDALCLLPLEAPVVEGLVAKVGLYTGHRESVPSIPLDSVSGRAGQGVVTRVLADGGTEQVTVQLGITDGVHIEVTDGLEVGDRIFGQAPGIK
nr:efflux RND transporter periplasmic adaptor subunit [Propionicimonas sp.]